MQEKEGARKMFTHTKSLLGYKRHKSLKNITQITNATSSRRWDTLQQIGPTQNIKLEKESIKYIMLMLQKMMNLIKREPKKMIQAKNMY
jgi:hypothetical protein